MAGTIYPPEPHRALDRDRASKPTFKVSERTSTTTKNGQPPISVADIGTGTGIWLVDLAPKLPPTARLDGFDFSMSKFRPVAARPPNVRLMEANALKPFPAELHGQYDLVHVRLLVLALRTASWEPLFANLCTLLRPGGYHLWEDVDMANFKGYPATTKTAGIVSQMMRFHASQGSRGQPYLIGLDQLMATKGFTDARLGGFKTSSYWNHPTLSRPTQRMMFTVIVAYLQGIVQLGGFEDLLTTEDAARKIAEMIKETEVGEAKLDTWYWRTIGRRSLEGEGR
ncbi:hypothetical protein SBRCBS47491_004248 [Sporothrix bragantina]|uniref:Methyltransferase domain-containing protein n=1 Tax=Sporothrix bragantina TaxID=671064 RepID=A0ABP0BN97_9PEZI